jgi:ankyrin repeat protein
MLLEKDSRVNATHSAAYAGHTENLHLLIASGSTHLQDCYGRTLLRWAASGIKTTTVGTLIYQHNIHPKGVDNFGRKPLRIAVKKGRGATSRLLQTSPPVSENSPSTRWTDCPRTPYTSTRINKSPISFSLFFVHFSSALHSTAGKTQRFRLCRRSHRAQFQIPL